jgi:hypothetical protein
MVEQMQSDPSFVAMTQQLQQAMASGGGLGGLGGLGGMSGLPGMPSPPAGAGGAGGGDGVAARDAAAAGGMPPGGMDPAAYSNVMKVRVTHSAQGCGHRVAIDRLSTLMDDQRP